MRGVQRRAEARIGQLLGQPKHGTRNDLNNDRVDFRVLAHALNTVELTDDECATDNSTVFVRRGRDVRQLLVKRNGVARGG